MIDSDRKVSRVIKGNEEWIAQAKARGCQEFQENGSYTILGCEIRNLKYYREMLGQDKRKLQGFHKELYQAI